MADSFSFATKKEEPRSEAIKWSYGYARYEVYMPVLKSLEVNELIPHGMELSAKVLTTVGDAAHQGTSLYEVFPRSLSLVLRTIWEQINQDADADPNVNNTETPANFDTRLREFIAVHATADDHYESAQFLRACRKPLSLPVQAFWYKLREYNSYIEWIPGNEPMLNEQQMHQAFHDAMPPTWRECFANAGNSVATMTRTEIVRYFRYQESQATKKMAENHRAQRKQSIACKRNKK